MIDRQIHLRTWFDDSLQATGLRQVLPDSLRDGEAMTDVLELTRRSAQAAGHQASALAAFVAGLAVGRSTGGLEELKDVIQRILVATT